MTTMMTRLQALWAERSDREQILLVVMTGLLALVLGYVLAVQPLLAFHDRARDDYAASMRLYRTIEAQADQYAALRQAEPVAANTQQSLRSIAGSVALRHQISIARLVPADDGSLTVNIDRAETRALLDWLIDLESQHGIQVNSIALDREDEVHVQANLVLRRGG